MGIDLGEYSITHQYRSRNLRGLKTPSSMYFNTTGCQEFAPTAPALEAKKHNFGGRLWLQILAKLQNREDALDRTNNDVEIWSGDDAAIDSLETWPHETGNDEKIREPMVTADPIDCQEESELGDKLEFLEACRRRFKES